MGRGDNAGQKNKNVKKPKQSKKDKKK